MKNGGAKTNKVFVDDEIDFELKNKSQKNDPNLIDTTKEYVVKHADDKKPVETPKNLVSVATLFRFATKTDLFLMGIGTIGALATGVSFPIMLIFFGNIIDTGVDFDYDNAKCSINNTIVAISTTFSPEQESVIKENFLNNISKQAIYLSILGAASTVFSYFQVAFWLMAAERQIRVIRRALFRSILRQEIGWFDVYKSGELTNRLTDDITKIKDGIGDKLGSSIQFLSAFISGMIIGFVRGWELTLVILSLSPLLFISAFIFTKLAGYLTTNELKSYAKAGAVAEEVFTAIRTVFAFNGSQKEYKRYDEKLEDARKFGIKKSMINGLLMGFVWIVINCAYALGFWYGWRLTKKSPDDYSVGTIILVFFNIIIGVFSLGNAAPFIGNFANARAAAYEVFQIIDRKSKINHEANNGITPKGVVGDIEFRDIEFKYPAREDVQVLKDLNLKINAGQTVALVGSSGCGKSTCIQLLQRFYDPLMGSISLDGNDLKQLNLKWLRTQIGVVNQEPILFSSSIADNIRMGRDDVTQDEIEFAAKNANAHDFIMTLPNTYNTLVGNRGSQLSGGQKQRVAIARALVRNPKILLLDEATSALDNESEGIVQEALDQARLGRTTIIVAHRLTTIRNADNIFAMKDGKVVESGTHDDLMALGGVYYSLVVTQTAGKIDVDKKKFKKEKEVAKEKELKVEEKTEVKSLEAETSAKEPEPSMLRVLQLSKPESFYIVLGCLASIVSGGVNPAFAIVFSKIIIVFGKCDDEQANLIFQFCMIFIGFGIATFISNFLQSAMFGISGENLTRRLRSKGFKTMLSQEIGWFDEPNNNIGALTTRLAVEAAAVQGATGVRIGTVLMNISNFGVGLVIAFVYGWQVTLLILGFVPFMIISGVLQTKMLTGFSAKDKEVLEEAGQISNQAISNIRTVAILNKEEYFNQEYGNKIQKPYLAAIKSANFFGFMFGFTNAIGFYANAAAYALGAYLISKDQMTFEKLMTVFSCIVFGAQSVGQASSMMPDYAKAKAAVNKMFNLFDRVPKINNWESESREIVPDQHFDATVEFDSIEFKYPSRPDASVLQNLSLKVKRGQRIALVGSSGCGKSTLTQLLERFYDVDGGEVRVSNLDVKKADLHWLRSQIGIVSQEPILFDGSIEENIAYGDNSRQVPIEDIIEAAKQANIHEFILNLPQNYKTNVGSKGTQLSGGQKQRIAIARALVRKPKILLLDEATSALDTESEKLVQEALDKAQEGRTCIIIAHRLTTIKNADIIYVIKEGRVIEQGNHDELLELNGFYSQLYNSH